ncbi:MAG: CRISPR-associated protein Cse1 [Armatimonadetes bacterium OLB18]|nr:MAG: CRISPR-associated protein Cse1 [Armatimonadetes bacterium OLB18]
MVLSRDLLPLFLIGSEGEALKGERRRSRPEVVTNALRATDDRRLNLALYGFIDKGGKNNKVFRSWLRSAFSFPAEVARDERLSYQALDAFKTAQKVADALQVALRMLRPKMAAAPRERKNLRNSQRGETDALAGFWQRLEPSLARTFLDDLAEGKADAMKNLKGVLRSEARNAFKAAADPHRRDADGLFRIANASNYLERRLARLLPKEKNL